jgi:capsular exopolysaccharide synthesis family protein
MAGKKTLLIGMDLRKPKIHKIFNLENSIGITNCLIGQVEFKDIVKETLIDNLFVAPSGSIPPNPAELIGSEAMEKILLESRNLYDIIILDTPPIGMVTDALLLSRVSDLSLFLLRQNYSSKNILELFEDIYIKNEVGKMGIILNDMKQKGYYGYGYRYYNSGYTYKYGYYSEGNEYVEGLKS